MTDQELFETVVIRLRAQGRPSKDAYSCRYRTASGLKCAVGVLIPDEEYDPMFEGASIRDYYCGLDTAPPIVQYCTNKGWNLKLLQALQAAHDSTAEFCDRSSDFMSVLEDQFFSVAATFDLKVPPRTEQSPSPIQ